MPLRWEPPPAFPSGNIRRYADKRTFAALLQLPFKFWGDRQPQRGGDVASRGGPAPGLPVFSQRMSASRSAPRCGASSLATADSPPGRSRTNHSPLRCTIDSDFTEKGLRSSALRFGPDSVLKVGPALTFAMREALFALARFSSDESRSWRCLRLVATPLW
jgi:D-tagatose-1,6-bisphosphate aldolase subunit GatZ/KbaZ-like